MRCHNPECGREMKPDIGFRYWEGHQWKRCAACGTTHRLIGTTGPGPGQNLAVDKVLPKAPWPDDTKP